MRIYLILIGLIWAGCTTITDSGFTNKAEAKNLTVNGLKEGKWCEYFDFLYNDTTYKYYRLTAYIGGKPYGIVREFSDKGELSAEMPYLDGQINGLCKEYSDNKIIAETPYKNGKIEGVKKIYYTTGVLWEYIPYKNGKQDGVEKDYYENGKLQHEAPFTNDDIINGVEKLYYEDGKLKVEIPYKNGYEGKPKEYDESGNEIK